MTDAGWYAHPPARQWRCAPAPTGVAEFHAGLPGFRATPLVELSDLAQELGVGRLFAKDESTRLGLPAFKILGASWATCRALSRHLVTRSTAAAEVLNPAPLDALRRHLKGAPVELVTATDGNHGRAVARMARLLGISARVVVPDGVPAAAVDAIAGEGGTVTVIAGSYDDAVRQAAALATAHDARLLIQDTAWPGYEDVPAWIVEGYATLLHEVDAQLEHAGAEPADLVAVPVGVGSLAQAVVTHYRSRGSTALLGVEPTTAACVLASLRAGNPHTIETGSTIMAGLNCGTPSTIAWPYLRDGLDSAIAVSDAQAGGAMRQLAAAGVAAGPCGAAALAGVRAALEVAERRVALGVTGGSTVVLLSTEGTTTHD